MKHEKGFNEQKDKNISDFTEKDIFIEGNENSDKKIIEENTTETNEEKLHQKRLKKFIFLGLAIVVLTIIITTVISFISPKYNKNYVLYLKDSELCYGNASNMDICQLTTNLSENSDNIMYNYKYFINLIKISEDGEIIFYPDKLDSNNIFSLFYKYKNNQDPIKVDSNIVSYNISKTGPYIFYLKNSEYENSLYQYNIKTEEKEKIDKEVLSYKISNNGEKIIYEKEEGLYLKVTGKEKEKIDSEIDLASYEIKKDFSTIYYIKENTLYKKTEGTDKIKIDSDVEKIIKIYESGELYYIKKSTVDTVLFNYINDDMKDYDEAITEPISPEWPQRSNFNTYDEYNMAYEIYQKEYEKYMEDYSEYYQKFTRDNMRQELKENTLSKSVYSLFYYNDYESQMISDLCINNFIYAEDQPVLIFNVYDKKTLNKINLSEITSVSEVRNTINNALFSDNNPYIAVKNNLNKIEQKSADYFYINKNGDSIFFLDDINENNSSGNLYKINISGNTASNPEIYDNDICVWNLNYISQCIQFTPDNKHIIYFKDLNSKDQGDLYIDKERIDYDVFSNSISYVSQTESFFYITNVDTETGKGTLKTTGNKKTEKILDEIFSLYYVTSDNEILYLNDYSQKYYNGELFLYKEGKSKKIDSDVFAMIPIKNNENDILPFMLSTTVKKEKSR